MEKEERGQISTEYLIIVGFIMFLIISILGFSLFYSDQIRDRVKLNQLQNFANKLVSSAEQVFYSGEPSKTTITAYLPSGVQSITIPPAPNNKEIIFSIQTSSGLTIISFSSNVPIGSSSLSNNEGVKRIVVTAGATEVGLAEG